MSVYGRFFVFILGCDLRLGLRHIYMRVVRVLGEISQICETLRFSFSEHPHIVQKAKTKNDILTFAIHLKKLQKKIHIKIK